MSIVKISSKGQVVIPKEIRKKLDLREGDRLKVLLDAHGIIMVPATKPSEELFIAVKPEAVKETLEEARKLNEHKLKELLSALGVKP